ncbi:MAG: ATP-binding protein [Candidatus Nitrosocosmicus sp.]
MEIYPTKETTEIWKGEDASIKGLINVMSRVTSKADIVGDSNTPSFSMGVEQIKEEYINFKKRGVKLRFITEITKENLHYCKELMNYVDLRHLDLVKGNMAISESEYVATANLYGEAKPVTQTIYSNTKTILEQQRYFFENLWSNAIPANQRIKEIEEGIEREVFDIIYDFDKVIEMINKLIDKCKSEIQIMFPNEQSIKLFNKIGIINKLLILSKKSDIFIKIIAPSDQNEPTALNVKQFKNISFLKGQKSNHGLIIVDNLAFLRMEFKDNLQKDINSFESFELAVYSDNKKGVSLFKSMFDLLWNERKVILELENADKLQKNFIDIAAHELRTPIQTILGLAQLLKSKKPMIVEKEDEMIDILVRNADRLKKLTENILTKTKIENQSLKLIKEKFDINEKIDNFIREFQNQVIEKDIKIILKHLSDKIIVYADKIRIYEVLSNLLNNAIQSSERGNITIVSYIENGSEKNNQNRRNVIIKITDSGKGIKEDLFSHLFTSFQTGSAFGTGLGLYVCKNIIEAHGGKIWAENNKDGKGATFYFSLPYN